jgi:hypothetical protein
MATTKRSRGTLAKATRKVKSAARTVAKKAAKATRNVERALTGSGKKSSSTRRRTSRTSR